MSLQPRPWPEVPVVTAQVVKAAFGREVPLPVRLRDELGAWYADADFAGAYPVRGKPGLSPAQLAMVTVLQFTEDLTDRQAAGAVRARVDWKYCLGLELADPGFEFTVLSGFRDRLLAGGAERVIFDALLARVRELGLAGAGGRQRTDSTHVLGRIRDLNRLELAGETVRAALEALAAAAPGWLAGIIDASWQQVYGQRIDSMRLPEAASARGQLAAQYGRDGYHLLGRAHAPGAPGWLRDLPAVQALRLIWIQQYYRDISADGEKVIRREASEHGLPPGADRIVSPYDTDARYSEKRGAGWIGYKVFLSESLSGPDSDDPRTGRPARPQVITSVATARAAVADVAMTTAVHDQMQASQVTPGEHVVDSGFMSAAALMAARLRGITLPGPLPAGRPAAGRHPPAAFAIDFDREQATCPQGAASSSWSPFTRRDGTQLINVQFPARTCRACPDKDTCTTAVRTGRQLTLHPRPVHEALTAARAAQATTAFKDRYRTRAGVEGTIAQATHVTGIRHARYRGLPKTRLEHLAAATAINCIRLNAWYAGKPLDRTRTTHLQRLDLPQPN
jgi:transposase